MFFDTYLHSLLSLCKFDVASIIGKPIFFALLINMSIDLKLPTIVSKIFSGYRDDLDLAVIIVKCLFIKLIF